MLHIHSIRITDGSKCYKPRVMKNAFVKTIQEVEQFEENEREKFISRKYPDGIPAVRDMKEFPIVVNATHINIPDREFLNYLVARLNYKTIPQDILNLFRNESKPRA